MAWRGASGISIIVKPPIFRRWRGLHGAVAQAIAEGDVDGAGQALDALLDNIEEFTHATLVDI